MISFLRCYSDEQHVGSSEDHVRGVTDPDVPDRVHDIHRKSDDNGENAEREFAPHCPRHLNQSYTESSKGTCSKINKLINKYISMRFSHEKAAEKIN